MATRKAMGAAGTGRNAAEQRRLQRIADRAQVPRMATAFPQISELRIEMKFRDPPRQPPAFQHFTLYSPAPAFFRFACPCAECDGEVDLRSRVVALAESAPKGERVSQVQLRCEGVWARDRADSHPCRVEIDIRMAITG